MVLGGTDGTAGDLLGRKVGLFEGRVVGKIKGTVVGMGKGSLEGSSVGMYVGGIADALTFTDGALEVSSVGT